MGTLGKEATEALDKSDLLTRFAAQSVIDPQQRASLKVIARDLQAARDAVPNWDAAIAEKFWGSYNDLCALIQPVNTDTLGVRSPARKWLWLDQPLPEITAAKYLLVLVVLLVLSVTLLALGSSISTSATAVNKLIADGTTVVEQSSTLIGKLRTAGISVEQSYLSGPIPPTVTDIPQLRTSLAKQYNIGDDLYFKTGPWWSIVGLFSPRWKICDKKKNEAGEPIVNPQGETVDERPVDDYCYPRGTGGISETLKDAQSNVDDYYLAAKRASERMLRAQSISNIVATFLAIILGMTGACAYIVRSIADQIRANSFSTTSPIRHQVRLWLGALAGVAIGFGGFLTSSTLSAAALAFLAGYAIEPVFATFDRIANSLK